MENAAAAAEAAGSGGTSLPSSSLPWHQIPRFEPGVTDLRNYAKKLEFIRDLWPEEHMAHLAPRAALLVDGVAFQKVARLSAEKLRTRDGVRYLVEALGGQWGKLEAEDRYDLFERALYGTIQKQDETNDSYLNRHDIAFEDLVTKKVQIDEFRAYILVRQSTLSSEDRKRIILECGGHLKYDEARKNIRLLGSRFFQDLQGAGKGNSRQKTYDIHQVDEPDENINYAMIESEMDEETIFQVMLEEGDEDASFVQDFEEQVLLTCQDSPDLAACFTTYQEARDRLREKARTRGYWPLKTGNYSKGKGKFGGKKGKGFGGGMGNNMKRRSLAERIANSTCRKCGQPGHWHRECPLNANETTKDKTAFTGVSIEEAGDESMVMVDVMTSLPENAELFEEDRTAGPQGKTFHKSPNFEDSKCLNKSTHNFYKLSHKIDTDELQTSKFQFCQHQSEEADCFVATVPNFANKLAASLHDCCRKHFGQVPDVATAVPVSGSIKPSAGIGAEIQKHPRFSETPCIFNVEEADGEAIIDTGASRAVIGESRVAGC